MIDISRLRLLYEFISLCEFVLNKPNTKYFGSLDFLAEILRIKFQKTEDGLMSVSTEEKISNFNKDNMLRLYNYLHRCIFTINVEFALQSTIAASILDSPMKFGCFFTVDSKTLARRHNNQ